MIAVELSAIDFAIVSLIFELNGNDVFPNDTLYNSSAHHNFLAVMSLEVSVPVLSLFHF